MLHPQEYSDIYQSLFEFVQMDYRTMLSQARKGVSGRHTHQKNGGQALSFMKNRRQINICTYF
jgi:hypothetical protein